MVRQISIKDSLYVKLSMLKGVGSFSNAIESLIEKCVPAETLPRDTAGMRQSQTD